MSKGKFVDYMVVHNKTIIELEALAETSKLSGCFIIPICSGKVEEIPDFSVLISQYILQPFYARNKEQAEAYVKSVTGLFYKDDSFEPFIFGLGY